MTVRTGKLAVFRHLRQGRHGESISGLAWYDTLKTTGNRVSYTLDSTLESVNTAEEAAVQMAGKAGFTDEDRDRISMAVREAAVNAVLHGNAYDPQKKMRVSFENTADSLVIKIADEKTFWFNYPFFRY